MEARAVEEDKKTQERQREMQRRMNPSTVQDFEVRFSQPQRPGLARSGGS